MRLIKRDITFGLAPEHVELETETGVGVIRTETELDGVKLSLEDALLRVSMTKE